MLPTRGGSSSSLEELLSLNPRHRLCKAKRVTQVGLRLVFLFTPSKLSEKGQARTHPLTSKSSNIFWNMNFS
jgi:hypothetical protein